MEQAIVNAFFQILIYYGLGCLAVLAILWVLGKMIGNPSDVYRIERIAPLAPPPPLAGEKLHKYLGM